MTWQASWPDGTGHRWLDALFLPLLPWSQPFFDELGLPEELNDNLEGLKTVAENAVARRDELQEQTRTVQSVEGIDGAITREMIVYAMHELARAYSEEVARQFERWARVHVVDDVGPLWAWQLILLRFINTTESREVPEPLQRAREYILEELGNGDDLEQRIKNASGEPTAAEREIGLDMPRSAGILREAIERESTLRCLERIRSLSSSDELESVNEWAADTAAALRLPEQLRQPEGLKSYLDGSWEKTLPESALDIPVPWRPSSSGDASSPPS